MQEKILLVEDDRDIVDYLSSFLKNENFIVEAVAGQREAIEKLETREYDLLLIDISLADGNDMQSVRRQRKNPRRRSFSLRHRAMNTVS